MLFRSENITAIKEASGSLDQVSELRRALPDHFAIYSGDDSMILPIMSLGGKGVVSVASHIVGPKIQEMVNAFTSGNVTMATKIHSSLYPVIKVLFITTNPVPVKAAMNMLGWKVGAPRLPMVEATESEREAIKRALADFQLL